MPLTNDKKQKKLPGAPLKLTPDLIDRLSSVLRRGAYIETACAVLCIDKTSFYRWMKIGAKKNRGLHRALYNAVHQALGEFEMNHVVVIDNTGKGWKGDVVRYEDGPNKGKPILDEQGRAIVAREATAADWKASAWALERRLPKRWGSKQTIENLNHDMPEPTEDDEKNLDQELEELRKANELLSKK